MSTFKELPSELILEIFSHYIRSEGHEAFFRYIPWVCKHWRNLSTEAPLWKNVRTHNWNFLLFLSRRSLLRHTQSLKFDCDETFADKDLSAVLKNIQDLKALDLFPNTVSSDEIEIVTEHCPNLESLCLDYEEHTPYGKWDEFFTVCGPTLKLLNLTYCGSWEAGLQLLSRIAAKCPLLEKLGFFAVGDNAPFAIHELRSNCPRLRNLEFSGCCLVTTERDDSLGCGFKHLKEFNAEFSEFNAEFSEFNDFNIFGLLKDSINLEHLRLCGNDNLVLDNISNIPSDNIRILDVTLRNPEQHLEALKEAVSKWGHTLLVLKLRQVISIYDWQFDIGSVLENFLHNNPNPQLESLSIDENINPQFLEEFKQKCKNLTHLEIGGEGYEGRGRKIWASYE